MNNSLHNIEAALTKNYTLEKWRYDYCCLHGKNKLTGYCPERYIEVTKGFEMKNFIYTSRPIAFDRETMTVTTKSGSKYKLMECTEDLETNLSKLVKDIEEYHARHSYE